MHECGVYKTNVDYQFHKLYKINVGNVTSKSIRFIYLLFSIDFD